jgi:hypothetical protein
MITLIMLGGGLFVAMALFALVALRWGADSRDKMDSPEWERRQAWFGSRHQRAA